jgi:hypothetical protein
MQEEPVYFHGYTGQNIGQGEHVAFDKLCEIPVMAAISWAASNTKKSVHEITNQVFIDNAFIIVDIHNESEIAIAREGGKYYLYINY